MTSNKQPHEHLQDALNRIKKTEPNFSLLDLQKLTGISRGDLSKIINGKLKFGAKRAWILSEALDIPEKWLYPAAKGKRFKRSAHPSATLAPTARCSPTLSRLCGPFPKHTGAADMTTLPLPEILIAESLELAQAASRDNRLLAYRLVRRIRMQTRSRRIRGHLAAALFYLACNKTREAQTRINDAQKILYATAPLQQLHTDN